MDSSFAELLRSWEIQTLNYQLVALADVAALLFLTGLGKVFNFEKIFSLSGWSILDLYVYLGPILAQLLSLVLIDAVNFSLTFDFGLETETLIYNTTVALNGIVQLLGNGTSVLSISVVIIAIAAGIVFLSVLPLILAANPILFLTIPVVTVLLFGPGIISLAGYFLWAIFTVMTLSLGFDFFYMLIFKPQITVDELHHVLENGIVSSFLLDLESDLEETLGTSFIHFFGQDFLQQILDDFGLHFGLHAGLMLPLAAIFTVIKFALIVGGIVALLFGFVFWQDQTLEAWVAHLLMWLGGLIIAGFVIYDSLMLPFIDYFIVLQILPDINVFTFFFADTAIRSFVNSIFQLESLYWSLYFAYRFVERWINSDWATEDQVLSEYEDIFNLDFSPPSIEENLPFLPSPPLPPSPPSMPTESSAPPAVSAEDIDLISLLMNGQLLQQIDFEVVEQYLEPVVLFVMIPLLQLVVGIYQSRFLMEMKVHAVGLMYGPPFLQLQDTEPN